MTPKIFAPQPKLKPVVEQHFVDTETAARAIPWPLKSLRHTLEADSENRLANKVGRAYQFSPLSLSVAASARPLVELGVPIEAALFMAGEAVKDTIGLKAGRKSISLDKLTIFLAGLSTIYLHVWKDEGKWVFEVRNDSEPVVPCCIVVHVAPLARAVLERAGLLEKRK